MWMPCNDCHHLKERLSIYSSYTHVRDNIHHLQACRMHKQHDKYYFPTFLRQGNAVGLNVMCSKQCLLDWSEFPLNSEHSIVMLSPAKFTSQILKYTMVRVKICSAVPEVYKDLLRSEEHLSRVYRLCLSLSLPNQHRRCNTARRPHRHLGYCIPSRVLRWTCRGHQYCN